MSTTFARMGVAAALALAFSAGAFAQQNLNPQGSGSIEMDHSRMGSPPVGGGTPGYNPTGSGSVEMTHPGSPGTGHGHEQGRQQQRR